MTTEIIEKTKALLGHAEPAWLDGMDLDTSMQAIEETLPFRQLDSKDVYLSWVQDYKALIKLVEAEIRLMHSKRRDPHINTRSSAQYYAWYYGRIANRAIKARRMGKIWSQAQKVKLAEKELSAA